MRISDWSSDVYSSDLLVVRDPGDQLLFHLIQFLFADDQRAGLRAPVLVEKRRQHLNADLFLHRQSHRARLEHLGADAGEIGRASCRERVCQYVSISVVAVSLKNNTI